jgi:hypothetical protein
MGSHVRKKSRPASIIDEAFDLHIHSSPDIVPRKIDFLQAAKEAHEAGMAGITFKNLGGSSVDRSYAASQLFPELRVFGGIVLDRVVGGLDPHAVSVSVRQNAKFIWFPVRHSLHMVKLFKRGDMKLPAPPDISEDEALSITDGKGELVHEVVDIMKIAKTARAVLATGHISPRESLLLVEQASKLGLQVLVNHPCSMTIDASLEDQKQMTKRGAYLEHCYATCTPGLEGLNPAIIAESIRTVGAEHCVMSTDLGQTFNPSPTEGLMLFAEEMRKQGISDVDIRKMIKHNPRMLLGLDRSRP